MPEESQEDYTDRNGRWRDGETNKFIKAPWPYSKKTVTVNADDTKFLLAPEGKTVTASFNLTPQQFEDYSSILLVAVDLNHCCICGDKIEVMCFKGTGVCCNLHYKARYGDAPTGTIHSTV